MTRYDKRDVVRAALARVLLALILGAPAAVVVTAQPPNQAVMNAAEIELALRKLTVLGSALYVAAHPDDENTAMLAYLSDERAARAAYLSITRGDGGQNLIGTEQGELLGLLRTQELLAARRIDRAEQFFARAIDFGFSKSPEEALRIWGHEAVLADVVWVIRRFRPDVIITRFPTTSEGGHGHHTASAILAGEAFAAAADPTRFPEQLRHVEPWQPKRLLWNTWQPRGLAEERNGGGGATAAKRKALSVDLGAYNPLLGKSYTEIAAASRSMHKSQGFGSAERRGSVVNYLEHVAGDAAERDLFEGVETSWRRVAGGEAVGKILEQARHAFDPANPSAILPLLADAHAAMNRLPAGDSWVAVKRRELLDVIRACAGLWIEAVTTTGAAATPGGEVSLTATLVNRSDYPFRLESIELPFGLPAARPVNAELKNNQPLQTPLTLRIPADAEITQPYWLRNLPGKGLFSVSEQTQIGMPENAPPIAVKFIVAGGGGHKFVFEMPALYRRVDRVRGELYQPFVIAPRATLNLDEKVYVFPDHQPKRVQVLLQSNAKGVEGTLRLRVPPRWRVSPEALSVALTEKDEELRATFVVTPAPDAAVATLSAELSGSGSGGTFLARGGLTIAHEHIPAQALFPPAEAKLVRLDLQKRGDHIGYVMGSGDEIPGALRQIGYRVTLLSDADLDGGDLRSFDAIITGVRAYNTRARLRQPPPQQRLLDYVAAGGTLIVQYNTAERGEATAPNLGPYPFRISRDRVTVEEAPIEFLAPQDALLNTPNKITAADFDGWVQERGLYFPSEWDPRYQTIIATRDPNEGLKRGGTLVARYGKGVYIYTGYAWFRQLPAGVPGAYRLFVNMISAGQAAAGSSSLPAPPTTTTTRR